MSKGKWKKPIITAVSATFVASVFTPVIPTVNAAPPEWAGPPAWAGQPGGPSAEQLEEFKEAKWEAKREKWKAKQDKKRHDSDEWENLLEDIYEEVSDEWDEADRDSFRDFLLNNFGDDLSANDLEYLAEFFSSDQEGLEELVERIDLDWDDEDWKKLVNWLKDRFDVDDDVELSLLYTNDIQGNLNDMPNLVSAVNEERDEDTLVLDSGNLLSDSLNDNELEDFADVINLVDYDAIGLGEDEFDLGSNSDHEDLAGFIEDVDAPFISTNVNVEDDEALDDLADDGELYKGKIVEIDGQKVGIFGLTEENTEDSADPDTITVEDYVGTAEDSVDYFEDEGIDIVIGLSNIDLENNATIAEEVDGIDVIIGGNDSDQLLEVTENADGDDKNPTIIVNAGQNNQVLGKLAVSFDEDGVIEDYDQERFSVDNYEADDDAEDLVE